MKTSDFKPSKAMGQNFLIDANIPKKIVKLSGIDKTCGVLEVGPGFGALTTVLAEAAGHVTAVEYDTRLYEVLCDKLDAYKNVTLLQGDILKQDLHAIVSETLPIENRHVCANLPYNITTPAISKLIESKLFNTITVMVQKEVGQRICATPGNKDYGAFTVFVGYHATSEILFDIPPSCFNPRPKVTSCVVKITMRGERLLSEDKEKDFFRIVRAAFMQRRKTLVNALYSEYNASHSKQEITQAIIKAGFDERIRGEELDIKDFLAYTTSFCNYL